MKIMRVKFNSKKNKNNFILVEIKGDKKYFCVVKQVFVFVKTFIPHFN